VKLGINVFFVAYLPGEATMKIPSFQSTYSMRFRDARADIHEVRSKVCDLLIPHKLRINNEGRPIDLTIRYSHFENLLLCYFDYQAESTVKVSDLNDYYIIEIPLSGLAETTRGRETFVSRRGQAVIISPGTHFRSQWNRQCTKLLAFIKRDAMEHQLSNILDQTIKEPIQFDLGLDLQSGKGAAWWRAVKYVTRELEYQDPEPNQNIHLNRHFEQMLISSLIIHHHSNYSNKLSRHCDLTQPAFLKKVESYIHDNCAEDITVEQLASIAGASVPRLFAAFRRYKGISPMRYVTNIRFERVHSALNNAGGGSLVSEIAMDWGFYQLGRFSQEYKKRYGESPSETLRN
jgi:AraC-like DNA-binding protein